MTTKQKIIERLYKEGHITFEEMVTLLNDNDYQFPKSPTPDINPWDTFPPYKPNIPYREPFPYWGDNIRD